MSKERVTAEQMNALHNACKALPVPDNSDLSHWCCLICSNENVTWANDLQPSGVRPQVICPTHGVNPGWPIARFRVSSITG